MKLSKLVLPLVCMCSLTSCGTVESEDFIKEAYKLEKHDFKYATVEYCIKTDTVSGEGTCKFTLKDGVYNVEKSNEVSTQAKRLLTLKALDVKLSKTFESYEKEVKRYDSEAEIKSKIEYCVHPFKVVGTFYAEIDSNDITGTRDEEYVYKFDKYGNLTFCEINSSYKMNSDKNDYKESAKQNTHTKISITYKD